MDDLTNKLKRDAQALDGDVPQALRRRIDAAIGDTPRIAGRDGAVRGPALLGWSSAAAGLAAVAAIVVLLDRPSPPQDRPLADTPRQTSLPLPGTTLPMLAEPLRVETVRLTGPLQEELLHLRADLEKARDTIERDLRESL